MNGMRLNEKLLVNAACGGLILNKLPSEAFKLFAEMAEEFREDGAVVPKNTTVRQNQNNSKVDKLCNAVKQMVEMMKPTIKKPVKACQLCTDPNHMTDQCPTLFEEEQVNAFRHNNNNRGNYGQKQRYDQNGQGYHQPWRNHENLRYGGNHYIAPNQPQNQPPVQQQNQGKAPTMEAIFKCMRETQKSVAKIQQDNEKFKLEPRGAIHNLNTQMAHMQQNFAQMNASKNNEELSPQIVVPNNKAQVNAVNLRSGKTLPEVVHVPEEESVTTDAEEKVDEEIEVEKPSQPAPELKKKEDVPKAEEKSKVVIKPPFPGKLAKNREAEEMSNLVKMFQKVEVNIPCSQHCALCPNVPNFLKKSVPRRLCTRMMRSSMWESRCRLYSKGICP
ncbi:uncharacterized protein LOC131023127 [Salvia miltiorrhiza]|uniref:uncharacterized protein LOC131023127 n=1 Tax=Salvia miltiorrhiza TaxID=226208 RepID=UPI0025AC9F0B|nr:uncharacterized protein LOC131023127 [Salvia miltiorrhiza]